MKHPLRTLMISLGGFFLAVLLYISLSSQSRFLKLCDQFFLEEITGNSLTLHYVLSDPETYGIRGNEITLGSYSYDEKAQKQWLRKNFLTLQTIARGQLSKKLQKTYDLLDYSLRTELERLKFSLMEEPLVPSIGIQSQLPILLAEYSFANEADVINYLTLLGCIPEYFSSLMELEEERIAAGLFMDEAAAQELITYCMEFSADKTTHFLSETFRERLQKLSLSPEKEQLYLEQNEVMLDTHVFPAYEQLQEFLTLHQQAGVNAGGLYYFPEGTDYYAFLLRSEVGVDYSFDTIEAMLENALQADARTIAALTQNNPSLLDQRREISIDTSNPAALTTYLSKVSENDFPKIQEVSFTICDVPKSMEPHLSPAFYLVPPIDRWQENVVYLNHGYLNSGISFFTTLAHESYPGHLYQTVFENSQEPHPIQRLLYFGGYTEGWATYAEQHAYTYAPIDTDLAALLAATRSMTLNLYSHLDLYVHGYGWLEEDCAAYLKKFGITNAASVHDMYLLVQQQPANYLKYYLGYLEICQMKEEAMEYLGNAFDLKEFHRFILENGPAPFTLLHHSFHTWIQEYPIEK